jgi:hypothetical protein
MTEENTNNNTESAPSFSIQDLVFTLHVYEACTQRGAFRADELSGVGAVYDRLQAFLMANDALSDPSVSEAITTPGE